jgi:hypothetical protein
VTPLVVAYRVKVEVEKALYTHHYVPWQGGGRRDPDLPPESWQRLIINTSIKVQQRGQRQALATYYSPDFLAASSPTSSPSIS